MRTALKTIIVKYLPIFLGLIIIAFHPTEVKAQFDDPDPFENCASYFTTAVESERCVDPITYNKIYPYVICDSHPSICCPAADPPSECVTTPPEAPPEEDEISDQDCGSWSLDTGTGERSCLDAESKQILNAQTCALATKCCKEVSLCQDKWGCDSSTHQCFYDPEGGYGDESSCQENCVEPTDDGDPSSGTVDTSLCGQVPGAIRGQCTSCEGVWTAIGCVPTDPQPMIRVFVGLGLSIGGGVALISIIAAGFIFSTSQGDPQKAASAKELMTSAIIGLLFVIFSITILRFIAADLIQIPGFGK